MKTRYGYVRSTRDSSGNYKFNEFSKELRDFKQHFTQSDGFPVYDFVPGLVHMLDDKPIRLEDLVKSVQVYNRQYEGDGGFDILDIPRQLLMGLEMGAISMVKVPVETNDNVTKG